MEPRFNEFAFHFTIIFIIIIIYWDGGRYMDFMTPKEAFSLDYWSFWVFFVSIFASNVNIFKIADEWNISPNLLQSITPHSNLHSNCIIL